MFTFLGSRNARLSLTTCPAVLKTRSQGTEVAGIARYRAASCDNKENLDLLIFLHSIGDSSVLSLPVVSSLSQIVLGSNCRILGIFRHHLYFGHKLSVRKYNVGELIYTVPENNAWTNKNYTVKISLYKYLKPNYSLPEPKGSLASNISLGCFICKRKQGFI